jgi:LuxR family maltose regulon positive regulatory protein
LQSSIEQFVQAQGLVSLAQVQQASGDIQSAFATIQRGKDWFRQMQVADTGAGALFDLGEVRLWIGLDNLAAAGQWSQICRWQPEDTALGYLQAVTLVRLRLAQIRHKMDEVLFHHGLEIIDRLIAAVEAKEWWGRAVELSLLRGLLSQTQGDNAGSLASLERALNIAEPEGYIRVFVNEGEPMRLLLEEYQGLIKKKIRDRRDGKSLRFLTYTDTLLAAFTPSAPVEKIKPENLLEALSERELDILRLIATGRSNQEIAEILFIAVSTVKSHINHLYGKLGANRRTQAIAVARDLGLLSN